MYYAGFWEGMLLLVPLFISVGIVLVSGRSCVCNQGFQSKQEKDVSAVFFLACDCPWNRPTVKGVRWVRLLFKDQ